MPAPTESGTTPTRVAPVETMMPRPYRVLANRRDTADTVTLTLEALDGTPFPFVAGQFTMLGAFGIGEVPISISGDPTRPGVLEHTVRDVGGVTQSLVAAGPGTVLSVRGPYGHGWAVSDGAGADIVVVAGGIGLAPLRPVLLEVLAARNRYRRVSLLYGARTPDDVLFEPELEAWRDSIALEVTVDRAPSGWPGRVGLVTALIERAAIDPAGTLALTCGPEVMMRYAAQTFLAQGVRPSRIRLSMERNMRCGIGLCGHCQLREFLICVDGPVFALDRIAPLLTRREL